MMGASLISSSISQKRSWSIKTALVAAGLEWLLICMLFVNAIFSYLITKFASYSELQIPCLLCSRLDHIFGSRGLKCYWDLICRNHKIEISSLIFCHSHNNLVDVHEMCESCLFSFSTIKKLNAKTYKLLVGELGENSSFGSDQVSFVEDQVSNTRRCACCRETWTPKGHHGNLMLTKSFGTDTAGLDDLLSCAAEHNRGYQNESKSEVPISDGNITKELVHENNHVKDVTIVTEPDNSASEKLMDPFSARQPSIVASLEQSDVINTHGMASISLNNEIGNDLKVRDWKQADHKAEHPVLSDLISLNEVPISDARDTDDKESDESKCISIDDVSLTSLTRESTIESKPDFLSDILPSSNAVENPVEGTKEIDVAGTKENQHRSETDYEEKCKTENTLAKSAKKELERYPSSDDNGLQSSVLDLSDAYKLAVGNRERQLSGVLEQWISKDSSKVSEDLKQLISQLSAAREQSMSPRVPISPKLSVSTDELKTPDASSAIGMQILQKRISLERNESNISLEGSNVSEIEGESVVDRMKRQIEHDKKLLNAMYKELEEERNASAIAANQALAMITKLQEEKAAFHMEALQCLRVMEEQAEYEMEAQQKKDELLLEKEKEIQDLVAELKFYKNKPPTVSTLVDSIDPATDVKEDNVSAGTSSTTNEPSIQNLGKNSNVTSEDRSIDNSKSSLLEFEEERLCTAQNLKKLETKLRLLSNNGIHSKNNDIFQDEEENINESKEINNEWGLNSSTGDGNLSMRNDEGSETAQGHVSTVKFFDDIANRQSADLPLQAVDQDSPIAEVSALKEQLKALEADQNFP